MNISWGYRGNLFCQPSGNILFILTNQIFKLLRGGNY